MNRGSSVIESLLSINANASDFLQEQAIILGWCVEIMQAFLLVADDIMDGSSTRRGQPCWYKKESTAINDAFILEGVVYRLLKLNFSGSPHYATILDLFLETTFKTELGQELDILSERDMDQFSMKRHSYIVEYKTAYYSFYLPVALGMILGGISDDRVFKKAENILLPLGEYFQVQVRLSFCWLC